VGRLQQTVGQRAFTVVYMGNDTKVPDIFHGCKCTQIFWIRYMVFSHRFPQIKTDYTDVETGHAPSLRKVTPIKTKKEPRPLSRGSFSIFLPP
jgi:hypothetical protein